MKSNKKFIINQEWDEIFNRFEENNFSNHAFPLYLFTTRLYDRLVENNCNDILFMSREGQYLKVLFEQYCQLRKEFGYDVKEIKTHYFYGSRNSIMTASAKPIEEENFEHLFRFFNFFIKPKMFLFSIGFTKEQIEEVRKTFGKKMDKLCLRFSSSKVFKELKQNETFRKIYEENRTKQESAFSEYMKTFDIENKNELFFVDIGYHGTMQDLIYKFFNKKVKMHGYFLKNRSQRNENNSKEGLLGDNLNKKLFGSRITKYDTFNYEQILRADHGRCVGYGLNENNKTIPLLDKDHNDEEIFKKYVNPLQEQILEKFNLIAHKHLLSGESIEEICAIYFYYTVKNKTKTDFNWILDMQDCHHDDFGYVGYPGRAFARGLRKFVFKIKDNIFISQNRYFVHKLRKNYLKNKDNQL